MIVQIQEMKIRGPLISEKMSKTVSMVKSEENLSRLRMTLKMVKCDKWLLEICIYINVNDNENKWTYMGGYSNSKGRMSGSQTSTWLLGTYHFW